ncbi:DUF2231 domain-containing protein [Desulfonatronum thiosulfatophilum]|nr:DUF2231 domain-containing protein [Desulfonatronum thiosulfatophilum]
MSKAIREFTLEEVRKGDGQEGRPVYVVFEGTVYDLSDSPLWRNGTHMHMHLSGVDLTDQLAAAPHFAEVFASKRVKEVGVLAPEQRSRDMPDFMKPLLRYFPMLRRHPHPISVHYPIAYLTTALLFLLLYFAFGPNTGLNFEVFAFIMLVLGVLSATVAVGTGFLTLWINYRFKKPSLVRWKIRLAVTLMGAGVAAIILRASDLVRFPFFNWTYSLLVLLLALLVMGLGYLGGQMVFPTTVHRDKDAR